MNLNSKVVWKDAADLGIVVLVSMDCGNGDVVELGHMVPESRATSASPDVAAVLDGPKVLSLAALTEDGKAFLDLVRSGDVA